METLLHLFITCIWLQCILLQQCSTNFVTTKVCNFEDNSYCDWTPIITEGEGSYGLTTAAINNGTQKPQTDYVPGNVNGSYFYYIKPNNYFNQALLLSYPTQKYLTNMTFAYFMSGPQAIAIIQSHVTSFEINSNFSQNQVHWEQATIQFTTTNPIYGIIIESPSLPGGGGEAPIEGDPFLAIDNIILTFTLPCDFNSLSSSGNLALSHPSFLNIVLGQLNSVQFNASSPICLQGPFIYTLESNNGSSLNDIIQFNSMSGQLIINATGPHLKGEGITLGIISVSVYVYDSDYMQPNGVPFKRFGTLHYHQPPTITITSALNISVTLGVQFTYTITSISQLNVGIRYSIALSQPSSLITNMTLTDSNINGLMSREHLVNTIAQSIQYPSFTVTVTDFYNETRNHTVQLLLPSQIPLIFNQLEYVFNIQENNNPSDTPTVGDILVGSIPYLNCQDGPITASITTNDSTISSTFTLISLPHTFLQNFCTFRLLVTRSLDYETRPQYVFNVTAYHSNRGLSSITIVTIQVDGENEYAPSISPKQQNIQVTDYEPVDNLVLSLIGTDNDNGQDGHLSYSITEGNKDYFKLVQISNSLVHLVIKHSPLIPGQYLVVVTVTDGGSPAKSDAAMVTISVIASGQIQCNQSLFGSPLITGATPHLRPPIYSNVTLQCNYTANPAIYPIQWYKSTFLNPYSYQGITSDDHYIIDANTLLINRVIAPDIGYYTCNITNQCGVNTTSIILAYIINYPAPPTQLMINAGPTQRFVSLTWTPPITTIAEPVSGYLVQLKREEGGVYETYSNLTYYSVESNDKINQIMIHQLYPGVNYTARILSVNDYFQSSSDVIPFTTLTSAPKLVHFTVSVNNDNAITVNWELEYSGGSHDLNMIIAISSQEVTDKRRRKRSSYVPISLSYPVSIDDNMLTTHTLPFGQHYDVEGVVSSKYGSSQYSSTVFIGIHDIIHCSFSMDSSCQWSLGEGQLTLSSSVSPPRPSHDASYNTTNGVYVLGSVDDSNEVSGIVLMSYTSLTYVCGISFYYQVNHNMRLKLETLKYGNVSLIWESPMGDHSFSQWILVNISIGEFPLSLSPSGVLRVTMETIGTPSPVLSYVAIDEVSLQFCLPCNYTNLTQDSIKLSYSNYSTLYIRQQNQTLSIQTTMNDCPNALLHYSIQSVIPNQLGSLISIPNQRKGVININDISTDIMQAGTTGYIIVTVEVLSSDYKRNGNTLSSTAVIHFLIAERFENCSYSKFCDFENGKSCDWELSDQSDTRIKQMSTNYVLYVQPLSNSQVSGEGGVVNIGHQLINDSYCGIGFLLLTHNANLQISVTDIGTIWSSWDTSSYYSNSSWRGVSLYIDVGSVPMMSGRRLSLEMMSSVSDSFIAIDNITLHPCIDCQAQECSCISCIQQCTVSPCKNGYYLSLDVNQCRPCPRGYYCDNWRSLPKPCPPGTYNELTGSYHATDCKKCSNGTYNVQKGSSSCVVCPTDYNCTNPSIIPVMLITDCNPTTSSSPSYMHLGIAAVAGLCAGIILSCLVMVTISCYCCHYKTKKVNKRQKKEHKMYADNFYVNPERHRKPTGYKSATVRTASTILSMMGKDTEDGNKAYTNPAFDSDSDDDFSRVSILTSDDLHPPPRDPSINSFQKVDWSDTEPLAGGREGSSANPFSALSFDDTKSEISDMIELDDHNDHVWPALQRKKKSQEKEEYDI